MCNKVELYIHCGNSMENSSCIPISSRNASGAVINTLAGIDFILENFILSVLFGGRDMHRKDKKSKAF